jgi:putative transposase
MSDSTTDIALLPLPQSKDVRTDILRQGAQKLLAEAIQAEVGAWIDARRECRDKHGHQQVVRDGSMPQRTILTGIGPIEVRQPRVHDRRPDGQAEKFCSQILPPYLRKTKSIEELIPWLYLKGVSTGDFSEALQALLGPEAAGLSATTVTRLKAVWEEDLQTWQKRSLTDKHYVYIWADGVHFNIRLEDDRQCILVLMGATAEGKKELIAVVAGCRESEQSWLSLLLDCKARGMTTDPHLAIGDGALGFWKALPKVWGTTRTQRCWVHKTANVLDKLPKRQQPTAKKMLHDIYLAATRPEAEKAFDLFRGPSRPSTARRPSAWPRIGKSCWLSMTSQRSTGCTCERRTRSNRCLPRCGCARTVPRGAARRLPARRWSSSSWSPPRSTGGR